MIPVSRPFLGDEELRLVGQVFDSGWLGHGATVTQFENELRALLGGREVVAVSSGTAALHLALDALGVGAGDEVIVPSLTFCASVQTITALGARPVFCDIEPDTLNLDLADARGRITPRTRAIMPVHFCGNLCDLDALLDLGARTGVAIVEDAAHAFGSARRGRLAGSFGDITCFSFDPIKNITCGEGGAVVLSDPLLADLIRRKRQLGMDRNRWQRAGEERSWWYEVNTQGYRAHMSNINAAIGLAQLAKLPLFRRRRHDIVRRYNAAFARVPGVEVLRWDDESCPFSYILLVKHGRRDALCAHLAARGIGSGVNYVPNHLQPHFAAFAVPLPFTERVYDEILTLPLFFDLNGEQVDQVIGAVAAYFQESELYDRECRHPAVQR